MIRMLYLKKVFLVFVIFWVVLPFLASAQNDTVKTDMGFDLGLTRNWDIDAWPILKIKRSAQIREVQIMWPVFKYQQNLLKKEKTNRFLPFYVADSSLAERDIRLGTLYFPSLARYTLLHQRKIKSFRLFEIAPEINFLEITRSQDGLFIQNNAFFFLWYKNDLIAKKSHIIVFPLYWQFASTKRISRTLFPLYASFLNLHDSSRFTAITPLYYKFRYPKGSKSVLFPLIWNRSDSQLTYNIVFPLFWHIKNRNYQSLTLVPFYSSGKSPDGLKKHTAITPLFWNVQNKSNKTRTLFPIYWHIENGTGSNRIVSDIVFPFYWHDKSKHQESHTLLPLFFYNKSKNYTTHTLFPVYSVGRSPDSISDHLIISPLYWKVRNANYTFQTFFPLYWSLESDNRKYKILFPLLWNLENPQTTTFSFFPLFSISESDYLSRRSLMVTPLFWRVRDVKKETITLFPLFHSSKRFHQSDTSSFQTLFPLYWHFKNKSRKTNILFPIAWQIKNPDYQSFSFVPLFSAGNSPDTLRKHLVVTPFFWYFKTPESESFSLFPIWWNRQKGEPENTRYFNVIFPIYWAFHDTDQKTSILFPLSYSFKNNYKKSYTLFPLFSFGKNHSKNSSYCAISPFWWHIQNTKGQSSVLLPLLWNTTRFYADDTVKRNILFPVFWHKKSNQESNTVLFPIMWDLNSNRYQSFTFFPLFSLGSSPDKHVLHRVISPFLWHFKSGNASSTTLLPFFHSSTEGFDDDKKSRQVLLPFYWRYKDANTLKLTLFPLLWLRDNENFKSFTLVPLYSSSYSKNGNFKQQMLTPLYWKTTNNDKESKFLLPLYYGFKKKDKNTRILLPLFYSFHDKQKQNDIFIPIWYRFQNRKYKSITLFPLFSFGNSPDSARNHVAISPLYWSFTNNGLKRSTLVPFFGFSESKQTGKSFSLFYFLLRYKKLEQRKTLGFIWPICQFESDGYYKYFRFTPIIWYKKSYSSSYFSVQPVFYHHKDSTASTFHLFWLLYQQKNYFGIKKNHGVLWRALYWENHANHDHEFRIMHFLFTHIDKEGNKERSFFPFYRKTSTREGEKSVSAALFFYNFSKKKIPGTSEFYQEQKLFWLIRYRSNIKSLEEKGIVKPGEKIKF